ncbi:MAG: tRNA pseudouridine(55) synthase TruB [Planctomycetes bacterium]|nr:tRNA pseudouridine(55) synthase TruB [Planctomycetota bacterium]
MSGQPPREAVTGIMLIDKPQRPTSMHVCRIVRRRLFNAGQPKRIKVGHGGTLDPLATGLLVVMIGKATRLCEKIMADDKEYLTTIDLAHTSPSDDLETTPEPVAVNTVPSEEDVRRVCAGFVGVIQQKPPIFSAMWIDGKRAYELARKGREVEMAARPVRIDECEVMEYAWPLLTIRVRCGKGTYIRSLARDIGAALKAGGMLRELRRTRIGEFSVENAIALDDVPDPMRLELVRPVPEELRYLLPKSQEERDAEDEEES